MYEQFENIRIYYNDSEKSDFISAKEKLSGCMELVTSRPRKITFIYISENGKSLTPDDFNVSFDEIPSSLISFEIVDDDKESFLVMHLPYNDINIKSKILNYHIQSDSALIKFTDDGKIINKQGGALIKVQIAVIVIFVLFAVFFFFILIKSNEWNVHKKFLVISLSFGTVLLFAKPPCSQYNDLIHFDTAYNMSNIMLGKGDARKTGVLLKRKCDTNLLPGYYPDNYYKHNYYWAWYGETIDYFKHFKNNAFSKSDVSLVETYADKVNKPQRAFVFSALMITIARLAGANQFVLFYLGALTNLVISIFLIYFSLKKNSYLKNNVIPIISAFPIVLMQFGSYSYDALLISISFALINYSISFYYSDKKSVKDICVLVFLNLFILPVKYIYMPLTLLLLLTYLFEKKIKVNKWIIAGCAVSIYILLYALSFTKGFSNLSILNFGNDNSLSNYTIASIIQHPFNDLRMFVNTVVEQPYDQICDLFIYGASWQRHPKLLEFLFLFLLVSMFFIEKNELSEFKFSSLIIFVAVSIGIFIVGMLWTKVTSQVIWGIQPRYFFPVIPLIYMFADTFKTEKAKIKFMDAYNLCIVLSLFSVIFYVLEIRKHIC